MPRPVGTTVQEASLRRAARSAAYRAERDQLAPYRELARQVILFRTRLELSQEELARRVGTSKSAIVRLESGRHRPNVETVRRVAEAFGTQLVIGFHDPPGAKPATA